jgi:hypothetical protein
VREAAAPTLHRDRVRAVLAGIAVVRRRHNVFLGIAVAVVRWRSFGRWRRPEPRLTRASTSTSTISDGSMSRVTLVVPRGRLPELAVRPAPPAGVS